LFPTKRSRHEASLSRLQLPGFQYSLSKMSKCGAGLGVELVMTREERDEIYRRDREELVRRKEREARGHDLTPEVGELAHYAPKPYAGRSDGEYAQSKASVARVAASSPEWEDEDGKAGSLATAATWVVAIAAACGIVFGASLYLADQTGLGAVVGLAIAFGSGVAFLASAAWIVWNWLR
jgi:hypothetical protein